MTLGTAAHSAVETDLRHKMASGEDLPKDAVQDAFRDAWRTGLEEDDPDPAGEKPDAYLDSGVKAVGTWRDVVAPITHPAMVEQPVQFKINGRVISGTLDVAHEDDTVGDWKFVSRTPDSAKTYLLNMIGYAIGFRRLTGRVERRVLLDHIVRTKEPKHVPLASDGPVPDRAIVSYAATVESVASSIEAGSFPPTGLQSGACSWCGVRQHCRYVKGAS